MHHNYHQGLELQEFKSVPEKLKHKWHKHQDIKTNCSDDPLYRQGQRAREKHEKENRVRLIEGTLNTESLYNQGYFGDIFTTSQLFSQGGVQPRQVKPGRRPPRSTMISSQAETPVAKSGNR